MINGLCRHSEMLFLLIKNIKVGKNIFSKNKSQKKQAKKLWMKTAMEVILTEAKT
jgi:hypothetical protein